MEDDIDLEEREVEEIVEEVVLEDPPYYSSPFMASPKTGNDGVDHLRGLFVEEGEKTSEVLVDNTLDSLEEGRYEEADRYLENLSLLSDHASLKEEMDERYSEIREAFADSITDEEVTSDLLNLIRNFSYNRFEVPLLEEVEWDDLIEAHLGSEEKERAVACLAYAEHEEDLKSQADIWQKMYEKGARPLKPDSKAGYLPSFGIYALERDAENNDGRGVEYLESLVNDEDTGEEFGEDVEGMLAHYYESN